MLTCRGDRRHGSHTSRGRSQSELHSGLAQANASSSTATHPPQSAPSSDPLTVYPDIVVPDAVFNDTTFTISITTRAGSHEHTTGPVVFSRPQPGPQPGLVDIELVVRITDTSIESAMPLEQTLRIPEHGDSVTLTFELTARQVGLQHITILFRQHGITKMHVQRTLLVRAPDADVIERRASLTSIAKPDESRAFSGLTLRVDQRYAAGDERMLRVLLTGTHSLIGRAIQGTVCLKISSQQMVNDLCRRFKLHLPFTDSVETRERRIRQIGAHLARMMLPQSVLCALLDCGQTEGLSLHIESADAWSPWEMLWLGDARRGFFLGERFAVTRWLDRGCHWPLIPNRTATLVAPQNAKLDTQHERQAMALLSGAPPRVLRTLDEVTAQFDRPEPFGLLHFACHGLKVHDDPLGGRIKLEQGVLQTVDVPMISPARERTSLTGACVFMNACKSGIADNSLSGHGGWAEVFIEAGAAAFIAPSWAVRDRLAGTFASHFYRGLQADVTVGEAARRARLQAREFGDPDRVAYAVYAAPNSRLVRQPVEVRGSFRPTWTPPIARRLRWRKRMRQDDTNEQ